MIKRIPHVFRNLPKRLHISISLFVAQTNRTSCNMTTATNKKKNLTCFQVSMYDTRFRPFIFFFFTKCCSNVAYYENSMVLMAEECCWWQPFLWQSILILDLWRLLVVFGTLMMKSWQNKNWTNPVNLICSCEYIQRLNAVTVFKLLLFKSSSPVRNKCENK